jgi:ABC-2 type transport system permease protein
VTAWIVVAVVVLGASIRLARWRRRSSRATTDPADHRKTRPGLDLHGVPLVASREVTERVRGRPFRIGTAFILLAVAAAIVIPVLEHSTTKPVRVGVVGALNPELRTVVTATAREEGIAVHFAVEATDAAARRAVAAGRIDLALLERSIVVATVISPSDNSGTALLAESLSYRIALGRSKPLPVEGLRPGAMNQNLGTSVIGVILIFVMLSQYNAWILLGVLEEKTSRVVEVLLAAVRPIQLLAGKILGIGLVAVGQATLIVAFALVLARAVGSNLLHGTAPIEIASALLWLVLGFAFYSWVYAAAASLAQRQDQVQSLALPLSVPILLGYVTALSTAASGNPSPFFEVLAYLPPTAPFAMTVLVGLGRVGPLGFCASVAISIVGTVGVARVASTIYRRAILRTGGRVRLREVLSGT